MDGQRILCRGFVLQGLRGLDDNGHVRDVLNLRKLPQWHVLLGRRRLSDARQVRGLCGMPLSLNGNHHLRRHGLHRHDCLRLRCRVLHFGRRGLEESDMRVMRHGLLYGERGHHGHRLDALDGVQQVRARLLRNSNWR